MTSFNVALGIDPALENSLRLRRVRTLIGLRESMQINARRMPSLAATTPTIAAPNANTAIATGTTWTLSELGSGAIQHLSKYTFTGGVPEVRGSTYPNGGIWRVRSMRQGNGTDPTANAGYYGSVRFACEAPELELYLQCAQNNGNAGFRIKVDGEYVAPGVAWSQDPVNGALRFVRITWGDGTAAHRRMRRYELEFDAVGGFMGIRTANLYKPQPWPVENGIRVIHHGDSQVGTVVDSTSWKGTAFTGGVYTALRWLLGLPDYWHSGAGGTGWFVPRNPKTSSWANDRVGIDVADQNPDVVIDHHGGNDVDVLTAGTVTAAEYEAAVKTWVETIIRKNPHVVIFMFGPIIAASAPASGHTIAAAAKRSVAALFPRNVVFIDTFTDAFAFGTGRQGATANDGNRDWVVGNDNAHFTQEGCWYVASRMANAIAGAIPRLIEANRALIQ